MCIRDSLITNNNQITNGAGYITGNQTITLTGDVTGSGTTSITTTVADNSHSHSNYIQNNHWDQTIDGGTNTTLRIRSTNGGMSHLIVGNSTDGTQTTGAIEVTQDGVHGGGISYNGDASPTFVNGETADWVTFYGNNNGTRTEVFSYAYSSTGDVTFNGTLTWSGGSSANANIAFGWGNHASQGYITDGNTNWDNSYGFITASSTETLTNKSGNISQWTNNSNYATQAYVGTQIANIVDSAPGALDTLNELASALGDDANFSTTVTNSIATKLPLAGGTLTGHLNLATYPNNYRLNFYDNSGNHSISSTNTSGDFADDIRINTYGSFNINLDSNNNNSSDADFRIARHASTGTMSDILLTLSGETGMLSETC